MSRLLALAMTMLALAGCSSGTGSTPTTFTRELPWAKLKDCLNGHPLFSVTVNNGGRVYIVFDHVRGAVANITLEHSYVIAAANARTVRKAGGTAFSAGPVWYTLRGGSTATDRAARVCIAQSFGPNEPVYG